MLNISGLNEGVVLDHIEAGKSLDIYFHLGLDKLDIPVAIIKNAKSKKMGKKDIIKIEGDVLDLIDFDVIGYIDHNITINVIKNNAIVEKKTVSLPEKITNIIKCKNPRCITSIFQIRITRYIAASIVKRKEIRKNNTLNQQTAGLNFNPAAFLYQYGFLYFHLFR